MGRAKAEAVSAYPFSMTNAKLVELIEVKETIGKGTEDDPYRKCRLWFTKGGHFVAIDDPCHLHERALFEANRGM